jgi:uncharacterized protein YdaU (DUF1376 family)
MNSVQFHIPDWTVATRHLSRTERDIYLALILEYYDRERPLPASDLDRLARRVMVNTEDERVAMESVLVEFFNLEGDVYRHHRCDEEIEKFHAIVAKRSAAGKESARARRKMSAKGTSVEHVFNGCSTHEQQPITQYPIPNTQEDSCAEPTGSPPPPAAKSADQPPVVIELPTNRNSTAGEVYLVTKNIAAELQQLYPAVNTDQVLRDVRGWLVANPKRRKTAGGMQRFLFSWFAREQDRGGGGGARASPGTRHSTLKDDLSDTSWAD